MLTDQKRVSAMTVYVKCDVNFMLFSKIMAYNKKKSFSLKNNVENKNVQQFSEI